MTTTDTTTMTAWPTGRANQQTIAVQFGQDRADLAADYKNRNVIERHYCHIKQRRGLATRYDKHAVILNAVIT